MKDYQVAAQGKTRLTPIAIATAALVLGVALPAQAQQQTDQPTEVVVVTGIRGSLQQSLNVKRNASANVEVITAEDVGKMPDKNVADSLQRLPGVNISTSAAGSPAPRRRFSSKPGLGASAGGCFSPAASQSHAHPASMGRP